jgi:hypothetical protein
MKKKLLLALFIITLMLAACSDAVSTANGGNAPNVGSPRASADNQQARQQGQPDGTADVVIPTPTPDPTPTPTPPTVAVGDIMEFGSYGWRVLDVSEGKALLLSEYILEFMAYNEEVAETTWETCTLRAYLNGEFLNNFGTDDRARIAPMRNSNKDNQWYGTSGGNDTDDYIFLLSL